MGAGGVTLGTCSNASLGGSNDDEDLRLSLYDCLSSDSLWCCSCLYGSYLVLLNLLEWPKFLSFCPGLPVATAFAARMIDVDGATGGSLLVLGFLHALGKENICCWWYCWPSCNPAAAKLAFPDIAVCCTEGPVRASDDCGVSSNLPVLLKYPGGISGVTQPGGAPYLFCSWNACCVRRLACFCKQHSKVFGINLVSFSVELMNVHVQNTDVLMLVLLALFL